jgi:hypothetical protein
VEVCQVPDPVPAAGELVVRVIASGINPVDVKTRAHVYETGVPPLPMTLGADTVVLDPYHGDPEETRQPDVACRALTTVATHWRTAS